nr:unnamed protein product [Callosobruchus analis]
MKAFRILSNKVAKFIQNETRSFSGRLYEPSYLGEIKSKTPLYDTLNIVLSGYDYPILENYQKQLHSILKNIEIDVEESWPLPPQYIQVSTYQPKSELVQSQYLLKNFARIIQITDVPSVKVIFFIIVNRILSNLSLYEDVSENNRDVVFLKVFCSPSLSRIVEVNHVHLHLLNCSLTNL